MISSAVVSVMSIGIAVAAAFDGNLIHPGGPTTPVEAQTHLTMFRSPSGNIGCIIVDDSARCDIRDRGWSPPPPPPTCDIHIVAYGQGLTVDPTGPGRLVCAGDTALNPEAPVLPYGATKLVADIRCESVITGMACTNTTTMHGFFLSAQRYAVY